MEKVENYLLTAQETLEEKILEAQEELARSIRHDDGTMIRQWEAYIRHVESHLRELRFGPTESRDSVSRGLK